MAFLDHLVGSFSTGAAANPTVAMMDAAFEAEGLAWRYVNCEVEPDDLAAAIAGAGAMGWRGFNCSMPHKQAVIPLLDELGESARLCQAVNCVTRTPTGWAGHNTDGVGFVASCAEVADLDGVVALVIGSGGAAHAIGVELALAGAARIHVAARNETTGAALAALISSGTSAAAELVAWSDQSLAIPPGVQLVVDATPVGFHPDTGTLAVDWSTLIEGTVVADVVFNPPATSFLTQAAAAGATVVDGTGMLVNQAAENIRLWTGTTPATAPMRAALERALGIG